MGGKIKGILLDLGDTVVDFGKVDITSLFEAGAHLSYKYLERLGQPVPPLAKYHRQQLRAIRWNYLKSRITRREFNALELVGRLATRMGQQLSDEQLFELAWLWYQPLSEVATVEPGMRELLKGFVDAGLTLGLISNTFVPGEVLDRHLERLNLLDLLPVRVYSCDVGYRKPNPNIFRIALERTGLRPGETLFVGDSLKADIAGAGSVGMISVLKDPNGRHRSHKIVPTHRIARLAELTDVLAKYNG